MNSKSVKQLTDELLDAFLWESLSNEDSFE